MNRLYTLIPNMLNSIPLPSLLGRSWGVGFLWLLRPFSRYIPHRLRPTQHNQSEAMAVLARQHQL